LNLQFCKNLINYDLPWNPMKLEQRIGRIHRLGQTSNVNIFNLFTINTVEEKILKLLYEKIKLFKAVMGNMDNILMDTNRMNSLEKDILSILVEANDEKELEERFNELGNQLKQAAKI
ncbi:MAG: ATP-dependent helicase, partial [Halanaerobiaceae bacterium]|nr:ATP-dependent helicase [Halanaerobiaceae bacterium]